jgi:hypothetical protein
MNRLLQTTFLLFVFIASVSAQSDIHAVDFKNFTYMAYCVGDSPQKITVKSGEFSKETPADGYVDHFYFAVSDIAYGDLNGDKRDEAIVITSCSTGGTGNFSEGFVFTIKGAKPVIAARIEGGDRAFGGLRATRVDNGLLLVDRNSPGRNGGACCPEMIITTSYKLVGNKLTKVGTETKRDLYPTERVTFAKGLSGKTFKITIPEQEGRRYIVGARQGQTLTVTVDTEQASIRLLGDVDVKVGVNNFVATLPSSGDFTIEVQNNSEGPLPVTLSIKIR